MTGNRLDLTEPVSLDYRPIERIFLELGHDRAEGVVGGVVEEMAVWLARAEQARRARREEDLQALAMQIADVSARLGMTLLAQVAGELAQLCQTCNFAGIAAVTARMVRVGEASVMAIWDLQDLSG